MCDDNHHESTLLDATVDTARERHHLHDHDHDHVHELVSRMKHHQTLVLISLASSELVKSSSCKHPAAESDVRITPPSATTSHCTNATKSTAERLLRRSQQEDSPNIVELRMGSFAGFLVSTQQGRCLDHRPVPLLHQLLRSAYVYGYVPSPYEQQYVPIVWLPDAVRAVQAVVERSWSSHSLQNSLQQGLQESRIPATASYHMYHVSSLNVNLNQAANEISLLTGAPVGYRQQSDGDKMEARPTKSTAQAAIDQEQQKLWRDGVKSQGKKKRDDEDEDEGEGEGEDEDDEGVVEGSYTIELNNTMDQGTSHDNRTTVVDDDDDDRPPPSPDVCGYSLDVSLFERVYKFEFRGNLNVILREIQEHVPVSVTSCGWTMEDRTTDQSKEETKDVEGEHRHHRHDDHKDHKDHDDHDDHDDHKDHHHQNNSSRKASSKTPCPVCGSFHEEQEQQVVLDMGSQQHVFEFRKDMNESTELPEYPMRLMRCTSCNHLYLDTTYHDTVSGAGDESSGGSSGSNSVRNSGNLLSTFKQQQQDTRVNNVTMAKHLNWFATKVLDGIVRRSEKNHSVLEIESGDFRLLDALEEMEKTRRGNETKEHDNVVRTFHKSLVGRSKKKKKIKKKKKKKKVMVDEKRSDQIWKDEWWVSGGDGGGDGGGDQSAEAAAPPPLDAIVVRNVVAHVRRPVDLLRRCRDVMITNHTRLYVTTSDCQNIFHRYQYDSIVHDRVSYFTAHSFARVAALSGLHIVDYEVVPVEDDMVCLVTMVRRKKHGAEEVQEEKENAVMVQHLKKEIDEGSNSNFFYERFKIRSQQATAWMESQLTNLHRSGYSIGAYGADASNLVLLNYLFDNQNKNQKKKEQRSIHRSSKWQLNWVLSRSHKIFQNYFTPGTNVPLLVSIIFWFFFLFARSLVAG